MLVCMCKCVRKCVYMYTHTYACLLSPPNFCSHAEVCERKRVCERKSVCLRCVREKACVCRYWHTSISTPILTHHTNTRNQHLLFVFLLTPHAHTHHSHSPSHTHELSLTHTRIHTGADVETLLHKRGIAHTLSLAHTHTHTHTHTHRC